MSNSQDSVDKLLRELKDTNTKPLWAEMARLNPPAPNPKSVPHIWKYDHIRPYLVRAGDMVKEGQAERRVLLLINPKMGMMHCSCVTEKMPEA